MAGNRAGDDDVTRLALRHVRHDGMNILHDGVDIEIEHLVDGFRRRLGEIAADIGAGIAIENVDMIDLLEDLRDHCVAAVGIEQIGDLRDGAVAKLGNQIIEGLLVPVHHDHGRALFQQRFCGGKPDAGCGAGDDRNLALQRFRHLILLRL